MPAMWGEMNTVYVGNRSYKVGHDHTPVIKFAYDLDYGYVLKPEGLFLINLKSATIMTLFELNENDRKKFLEHA